MSSGLYSGVSGLALGTGLYKDTSGLWGGASGLIDGFGFGNPTLDLNFLPMSTLPSTVTFSRTTQATLVDATGRVTYAPNNLATNSESFEAAAWVKTNTTVTANSTTAPDGTSTADTLTASAGAGSGQQIYQALTSIASGNYVYSIYAKQGSGATDSNLFTVRNQTTGVNAAAISFNYETGVVTQISGSGATAANVGGGWWRLSIPFTLTATLGDAIRFYAGSTGAVETPGEFMFAWGAQLEAVTYQTTPGAYNSTTPKNLLGFTQEFDNAAWNKSGATVTANSTAAPDGTTTADALVEDATTGLHLTQQSVAFVSGVPYTVSVYVKAGTRTWVQMLLPSAAFTTSQGGFFDLTGDGALGSTNGTPTARSITAVGNGWYRISVTATATTSASGNVAIVAASANGTTSYAGSNGSTAVSLWGAQLSNSASLDPYVYNPAAAPTSAAYYGPRFDYNPVTLAPRGLLIEEQRTNRTLNSEDFTAATWVATVVGTSTRVNDGAPLGFTRGLITATSANGGIRQVHSGLASGQVYALSFYIQSTANSVQIVFENGTSQFGSGHNVTINPSNGTAGVLTGFTSVSIQPFGPGYVYTLITAPAGGALAANIEWRITNSGNSIWLGRPQFEAGAFATSYIPTAASQVTRNADVATMVGANFASWYNGVEGTLLVDWRQGGSEVVQDAISVNDGTISNVINVRSDTSSAAGITPGALVSVGGVTQASLTGSAILVGSINKSAFAYAVDNFAYSQNGAAALTDTSGSVPAVNRMDIGNRLAGTFINGHIRSIRYYPTRLSNAQLQALTA